MAGKGKIRIGLVGCGGMAQNHVARFEKIRDRIDVVAAVDIDRGRAEAVAKALGADVKAATDYHAIIPEVDAALLVLPHHLHCRATLDFLRAGKHVLVEKPLANTEKECLEMIRASRESGKILMVAYCMRFHPLVLKMKELLDDKTFGECFQLSIWTEQFTRYAEGHWAHRAATVGGGQFFSHGCHYVDLMLWMMGRPGRGCHFGTNKGTPWMEKEGTSNVAIEFENKAMGYHFGTWGARGSRLKYAFHAHCEKGMLEIDLAGGKLIAHKEMKEHVPGETDEREKTETLLHAPFAKPTEVEMAHFADCIESGRKPLTDAVGSLEGLKVIWSLYEAEEQNKLADLRGMGLGTMK